MSRGCILSSMSIGSWLLGDWPPTGIESTWTVWEDVTVAPESIVASGEDTIVTAGGWVAPDGTVASGVAAVIGIVALWGVAATDHRGLATVIGLVVLWIPTPVGHGGVSAEVWATAGDDEYGRVAGTAWEGGGESRYRSWWVPPPVHPLNGHRWGTVLKPPEGRFNSIWAKVLQKCGGESIDWLDSKCNLLADGKSGSVG